MRSCFAGKWRFFASRPDVYTPGQYYFVTDNTPALDTPHAFGSAHWFQDGLPITVYPTGLDLRKGTQWRDGQAPNDLPPISQVGSDAEFNSDALEPQGDVILANGFDLRCYTPNVFPRFLRFFRPDILDCCWQRVCAALLAQLQIKDPSTFENSVSLLWPDPPFTTFINPVNTEVGRFAWIEGPTYQIVFHVGTQIPEEMRDQLYHGFLGPQDFGRWSSAPGWFAAAQLVAARLQNEGFNPDVPTTLIGHSRGAAVLWLLGRAISDAEPTRDVQILTFGCPKAGDIRCTDFHNFKVTRHVADVQDIVPQSPPPAEALQNLRYLLTDRQIEAIGQWRNFPLYQIMAPGAQPVLLPLRPYGWQQYASIVKSGLLGQIPPQISDHFLATYVRRLNVCCVNPPFPFSDEFWEAMFGAPDNAIGGAAVGFKTLPDDLAKVGNGGIALGGSGGYVSNGILLEDSYNILTESNGFVLLED